MNELGRTKKNKMRKPADTFVRYVNLKYREELKLSKKAVLFYNYDEFSMWLFYDKYKMDYEDYYCELEECMRGYSDHQQKEVERKRLNAKRRKEQSNSASKKDKK